MEKFTLLGDTAVRFKEIERGEKCLVLLHGYLESMDIWDDFGGQLAKAGYRVVTLDLPGHGISEIVGPTHSMAYLASIVAQLLDKQQIEKATLIGHSMGGYVALAFAEAYPEKTEGVVLFHATADGDSDEKKENRRREIEIITAGRKEMLARTFPGKRYALENRRRMAEEIDADALQVMLTEDEGIVALLRGMMERKDQNEMLAHLDRPQLFLFGRHDELLPPEKAEAAAAKNPQAQVAWLEHSGHMGFVEEPEASLRIIQDFIPL
ncbi:MAG: alpha/beta hydrolase [Rikenellaceae bacterium]|jgi:pimeloyl-ACP methyl ester carboxylesterase|nr:alpha/beta hydrolase [Rikenellaceae bacterium]